jgi:hypothetical protein
MPKVKTVVKIPPVLEPQSEAPVKGGKKRERNHPEADNLISSANPRKKRATRAQLEEQENTEDYPECHCGTEAKRLTVRKEGPNKGRMFYSCSQESDKCKFFEWYKPTPLASLDLGSPLATESPDASLPSPVVVGKTTIKTVYKACDQVCAALEDDSIKTFIRCYELIPKNFLYNFGIGYPCTTEQYITNLVTLGSADEYLEYIYCTSGRSKEYFKRAHWLGPDGESRRTPRRW